MKYWLPNVIGFQLVWLAAVAGAGMGLWWPGILALAIFASWQLGYSHCRTADIKLIAAAVALGFVVDSAWIWLGLLHFATPVPWDGVAPVWILVLWASFALTLNHSLASLKARPWLAALLGAAGGPLAYWIAGSAWKAASFAEGAMPYIAIGLAWAVLTPALLELATRLGGPPRTAKTGVNDARA